MTQESAATAAEERSDASRLNTSHKTKTEGDAKVEPETLPPSGKYLVEAWMDLGAESLEFMAGRVRKDVQLQHDLLHCRHPGEVMNLQLQFLQKAIDDYHVEYARLSRITRGWRS